MVIALLFAAVFLVLGGHWLIRGRLTVGARGSLMLSVDQRGFDHIEAELKRFLGSRLKGLQLQTMSVTDGRVNLQYQYKQQSTFDWTAFANELNAMTSPAAVEMFVG